jgi:hypothetical protein
MVARGRSNLRKRAVVLVFGVVLARGKPNPRKRAVVLVFERCGRWCWPEKGSTPENERNGSFSGRVGGAGQRKAHPPKTSGMARFRGLWVVVVAKKRS